MLLLITHEPVIPNFNWPGAHRCRLRFLRRLGIVIGRFAFGRKERTRRIERVRRITWFLTRSGAPRLFYFRFRLRSLEDDSFRFGLLAESPRFDACLAARCAGAGRCGAAAATRCGCGAGRLVTGRLGERCAATGAFCWRTAVLAGVVCLAFVVVLRF